MNFSTQIYSLKNIREFEAMSAIHDSQRGWGWAVGAGVDASALSAFLLCSNLYQQRFRFPYGLLYSYVPSWPNDAKLQLLNANW